MGLAWHINRLRAMSAPEIVHRVHEQYDRLRWRRYADGWNGFGCGDGSLPRLAQLGHRLEAAACADPSLAARIAAETQKLIDGEFHLLGQSWPSNVMTGLVVADPSLFHRDPVTGQAWPSSDRFCFDVPYRRVSGLGDVKFLWEINRLQFLQVAAAHARLTGDEDLKRRIFEVIFAWMDANVPVRGPNWSSGIELSMRLVTLVIVLSFLGEPTSPDDRCLLRTFVNAHAVWLVTYPSRYSSANNHSIAEGLGLLLAGLLMPDLPSAVRFEREGRARIERECLLQICSDGVGVEQSPTYTAFTMEMIGFAALTARLAGRPLADTVSERLAAAADYLHWIMNVDGDVPSIGDNDEGRVLVTSVDSDFRYACSIASCVARPGDAYAPGGREPEIREALFGLTANGSTNIQLKGRRTFREGGYSVVRDEIAGRPMVLAFDHGPLGYLSIAAHGHADALAVWLDVAGRPVLADAGTWLYHAGGKMRDWLRSTAAHNTVLVEGASQSLPSGPFNWSHKARAEVIGSSHDESSWWFEAAHDGYYGRFGVNHVRRVAAGSSGEIVISDRLEGKGVPRQVAIQFLFAPDLTVSASDGGVEARREDGLRMLMAGPDGFEPRLTRASKGTPLGWVSQRFGHRTPSTAVSFVGDLGELPEVTRLHLSFEHDLSFEDANGDAC